MGRALMFQGTGSDVGKSTVVAGLCRLFRQQGLRVRPFKPQNMSNNAAVTADGGEIGRAQALQALACGVAPSVHMNPVLIKPESDTRCQVVVHGRVKGNWQAAGYQREKPNLLPAVMESFASLRNDADLVLVEGAGSPAETNLRAGDIANMGFARAADVPVCLIADIDRGGVIAQVVGTKAVLSASDNAQIVGYLVNKFRGDPRLFDRGLDDIQHHTNWRCFGVLPWQAAATRLPSEDGVALERVQAQACDKTRLKIAVPMLSRIANFDDVDPLAAEPNVVVEMVPPGRALPRDAELIVIPGSKATRADLDFFRAQGWDLDLRVHLRHGGHVVGLCGGYQMLGLTVSDPQAIEGPAGSSCGLGLLNVHTTLQSEKCVRQVRAEHLQTQRPVSGYEIHSGITSGPDTQRPVLRFEDQRIDGAATACGHVWGTYMHGLFAADDFRRAFLRTLRPQIAVSGVAFSDRIEAALDELASALESHVDTTALLACAR